jgi:hypothetical protein
MNGKKYDWEAVIRIPFIDQDRLLAAMRSMAKNDACHADIADPFQDCTDPTCLTV